MQSASLAGKNIKTNQLLDMFIKTQQETGQGIFRKNDKKLFITNRVVDMRIKLSKEVSAGSIVKLKCLFERNAKLRGRAQQA